METMKDGTGFNPNPMCQVPTCSEKSAARIIETDILFPKRKDVCKRHAKVLVKVFRDKVDITATWNNTTMEDYEDE